MITLAEVLRKSGWTQEQIDALDANARSGLTGVLTEADKLQQEALQKQKEATEAAAKADADRKAAESAQAAAKAAQDAAEFQQRSVADFWANTYGPTQAAWEADRAKLAKEAADAAAEAAFYKAQRETYLKTLNIDPANAPAFTASAAPAKVEPVTPGTPTFVDPNVIVGRVGDGMNTISDIAWKYQTLYGGKPLPVAPSELIKQADALKLSPMEYAARTFKFAEMEQAAREAQARAHDEQIAATATAAKEAEWKAKLDAREAEFAAEKKKIAEGAGSNPDVKLPPGASKYADVQRAVKAGERPDPTRLTPQARRQLSLDNIHKFVEERQGAAA